MLSERDLLRFLIVDENQIKYLSGKPWRAPCRQR